MSFSYSDDGDGNFENDQRDVTVDNNVFDGCAMSSFWSPGCLWVGGYDNMTVSNNDFTNAPFTPINVKGSVEAISSIWELRLSFTQKELAHFLVILNSK